MTNNSKVEALIKKYAEVFQSGLGTMKSFRTLDRRQQAKVLQAKNCFFTIKNVVGKELDGLEEAGIMIKENYSEWPAPIVPVPIPDGSFRVCGDFK